jgi:broad specificity phosphatase PhoE
MILYILPTPLNKLDTKERVSGWHFIPLERKAKEAWKALFTQLKDKGIEYVVSGDLDQEAARIAGNELHVPVRTEFALRRFNFGRHHASKLDAVADILGVLEQKWQKNADVPIKGGDSLTSFERRFARRFNTLLSGTGTALFVTDPLTIAFVRDGMCAHALVPNGNPVKREKIFKVQNAGTN